MPSTYSPSLRLELIGAGEQAANWNNTTNYNLGTLLEQAIAGVQSVAVSGASYTLTTGSGVADEARNAVLVLTGTLAASCNVIVPTADKTYTFRNATTGGFSVVVKTAAGSGVTIANGFTQQVYCDATNVVAAGVPFNAATNTITTNVSGNIAAGAGSAAVPSVTFGDTDTGIYGPAVNELGFSANGTEVLRLSASALSYISGSNSINLTTDGALEITRNGGGGYIDIKSAAGEDADVRILETSNGIGFQTGGNGALATRMVINSTGQIQSVGSGTAAAPAFSFSSDTDTGIHSLGANALGLSVGGVALLQLFNDPGQAITVLNNVPGQTFIPFYMRAVDASASNFRLSTFQSQNENSIPLTALNLAVNTDGSGDFSIAVTPSGARTSDRRVTRWIVPGSGAVTIDGKPVGIRRSTAQATTSGTAIDFLNISAGARRITLVMDGVSLTGTDNFLIQIGAGSFATSGYTSQAQAIRDNAVPTAGLSAAGFILTHDTNSGGRLFTGRIELLNIDGNEWVSAGSLVSTDGIRGATSSGKIALGGALDRFRLTRTGTDTFDAGKINLLVEYEHV
jgi:hypothetical protein